MTAKVLQNFKANGIHAKRGDHLTVEQLQKLAPVRDRLVLDKVIELAVMDDERPAAPNEPGDPVQDSPDKAMEEPVAESQDPAPAPAASKAKKSKKKKAD